MGMKPVGKLALALAAALAVAAPAMAQGGGQGGAWHFGLPTDPPGKTCGAGKPGDQGGARTW